MPSSPTSLALGALGASVLSGLASAQKNYTQIDMMRAQLALMDDRPDCPPW